VFAIRFKATAATSNDVVERFRATISRRSIPNGGYDVIAAESGQDVEVYDY